MLVWITVSRPGPDGAGEPRFVLLLYAGATPDADEPGRRAEYEAWARGIAEKGTSISGEELANDDGDDEGPRGFFIISAPNADAARAIAATCPHLRHGGRIVVRRIVS